MKRFIVLFTAILGVSCLPFNRTGNYTVKDKSLDAKLKIDELSILEKIEKINKGIPDGLLGDEVDNNFTDNRHRYRRVAWHDKKWPKTGDYVYIPYRFGRMFYSTRNAFLQAVAHFNNRTCVRWIPWTTESYYVYIIQGFGFGKFHCHSISNSEVKGCYAYIGKRDDLFTGYQRLSLSYPACAEVGIAIHEAMHAIGFYHTMARKDRDNFIEIDYSNMWYSSRWQFRKHNVHEGSVFGQPFDFNSVMMYSWNGHAIDSSRPTIIDKSNRTRRWQLASLWSQGDVEQINRLYQCRGYYTLDN